MTTQIKNYVFDSRDYVGTTYGNSTSSNLTTLGVSSVYNGSNNATENELYDGFEIPLPTYFTHSNNTEKTITFRACWMYLNGDENEVFVHCDISRYNENVGSCICRSNRIYNNMAEYKFPPNANTLLFAFTDNTNNGQPLSFDPVNLRFVVEMVLKY